MTQALDAIADRSMTLGKKIFDSVLPDNDRSKADQKQETRGDKRV
jgi:hypothetical protein